MFISETALRVEVGGLEVMRAQLEHLADLAARPNITVQVLPFTAAAHVNPITGFRMLDFPDPRDPTIVYIEHLTGALFLEHGDETLDRAPLSVRAVLEPVNLASFAVVRPGSSRL